VHYPKVKLVVDEIILQSIKVGFTCFIVKDDIITLEQEVLMLEFELCFLKTSQGLTNKMIHLCSFFIHDHKKCDKCRM
jgi:hypothetical protein